MTALVYLEMGWKGFLKCNGTLKYAASKVLQSLENASPDEEIGKICPSSSQMGQREISKFSLDGISRKNPLRSCALTLDECALVVEHCVTAAEE
jgi:hypothetical protein